MQVVATPSTISLVPSEGVLAGACVEAICFERPVGSGAAVKVVVSCWHSFGRNGEGRDGLKGRQLHFKVG